MKSWTFAALVAASLATAAPAAAATTTTIPGAPLKVYVGDRGQLQAARDGDQGGIFYPSDGLTGDAGFFLAFPAMSGQNGTLATHVYGFEGTAGPDGLSLYTPVSQSAVSGAGTAASPFAQETTFRVSTVATVKQTTTYVNGAQEVNVRWDVTNDSGLALPFKALVAADFYFEGSDAGTGIFTDGPPRFVGGTSTATGRSGGFVESTPWSTWQALSFAGDQGARRVWDVIEGAAAGTAPSFDKSIETRLTDNAGGVEWDDALSVPLASHATKSYELSVRSSVPAALQFDRTSASTAKGAAVTFVATAKDTSGQPYAGRTLRYSINGANSGGGAVTIDANGNAAITDPATWPSSDTIAAYVDLNGSGTREGGEPQATALVAVAAPADVVAPACTVVLGAGRPGAGKPVTARVKCDSPANLKIAGTLTPAKKKKPALKLPATAAQALVAGTSVPVALHVPKAVAKKYAGAKVTATITVTATDVAGNRATKAASRTLTLAAVKKSKHRRR